MKNEGLILSNESLHDQDPALCDKLLDIMNQIDDGRGWRYTDEQTETLARLVDNLIENIKAYNKERNQHRKRHGTI